jgi:hypothetical protein
MKLTDAQMDLLVPACEKRLRRLSKAHLMEFEQAMERTFMPYIRTQLKIFDAGGGFSALPGLGIPGTNDSVQEEDAPSPHTDTERLQLEDPDSLRASASADVVILDGDTASFDWPDVRAMDGNMPAPELGTRCWRDTSMSSPQVLLLARSVI